MSDCDVHKIWKITEACGSDVSFVLLTAAIAEVVGVEPDQETMAGPDATESQSPAR